MTGTKTLISPVIAAIKKAIAKITATGLSPYRSNTSISGYPAGFIAAGG
jgi:hypothetical protein